MKVRKGDTVKVIQGKDRGQQGKVIQVFPKLNRIVVDGVNQMSKNVRARRQNEKGQVVKYNAPLHVSNVMVVDSKAGKPTRVGYQIVNGKKERISRRSKQVL
jgi:large subunit ribosomal protein L24